MAYSIRLLSRFFGIDEDCTIAVDEGDLTEQIIFPRQADSRLLLSKSTLSGTSTPGSLAQFLALAEDALATWGLALEWELPTDCTRPGHRYEDGGCVPVDDATKDACMFGLKKKSEAAVFVDGAKLGGSMSVAVDFWVVVQVD